MKDAIGQEININDVVGASAYAIRTSPYIVVGFTPKQVKLVTPGTKDFSAYITKPPSEILVVPGGAKYLAEQKAAEDKKRAEKNEKRQQANEEDNINLDLI